MDIEKLYTFSNFKSKCVKKDLYFIEGERFFLDLYKDCILLTEKGKEICFVLIDENTLKLDYIGIQEKYRGGILKELHSNCCAVLNDTKIRDVILRPLSNVLSMWIYFGFDFMKSIESIRAKLTFINYLKTKKIISEDEIETYDNMQLKDIVIKHKDEFKAIDFPKIVEKELYYTNMKKGMV